LEEDRADAAQAVALCQSGGDAAGQCLSLLVDHADFMFGSDKDQRNAFCRALPRDLQLSCIKGPR
jgi:hypothetical protein